MAMGPRTKKLLPEEISALQNLRATERLSMKALQQRMEAPFDFSVLQRAIDGKPVWDLNHRFITEWIAANLTATAPKAEN